MFVVLVCLLVILAKHFLNDSQFRLEGPNQKGSSVDRTYMGFLNLGEVTGVDCPTISLKDAVEDLEIEFQCACCYMRALAARVQTN